MLPTLILRWALAAALTLSSAAQLTGCASPPPKPKPMAAVKASQVIPIAQTERGVLIVMPTDKVAFDSGKASFTQVEAHEFLDRVASILKDKTNANIVLEGHTDSQGARPLNQKLSDDRAQTIREELGKRGVVDVRMSAAGFAFDKPVAPNDTDAGRKENRRVELTILGEQVANITRGEPPDSFEEAFVRLKTMIEKNGLAPTVVPAVPAVPVVPVAKSN